MTEKSWNTVQDFEACETAVVLSEWLGEDGIEARKASGTANWKLAQGPVGTREGMLP